MKRRCFHRLLVGSFLTVVARAEVAPWPGVAFASVRAFAWKEEHTGSVVLPGGKLAPGALQPAGVALSVAQQKRLVQAEARRYIERPQAGCYEPHNAFVFYDEARKPVASIEVCFDCLGSRLWPEDPESDPDYIVLAEICAELKVPFGRFKKLEEFRAETARILGR